MQKRLCGFCNNCSNKTRRQYNCLHTKKRFKKRTVAAEVSDGAGDHPRRRRVRGVTRERPEHLHGAAVQYVRL